MVTSTIAPSKSDDYAAGHRKPRARKNVGRRRPKTGRRQSNMFRPAGK